MTFKQNALEVNNYNCVIYKTAFFLKLAIMIERSRLPFIE